LKNTYALINSSFIKGSQTGNAPKSPQGSALAISDPSGFNRKTDHEISSKDAKKLGKFMNK
jgi:hypothetical protein